MNEYTFFEAAAKAKVGETLKCISGHWYNIKKTEYGFYWQNEEKEPVELKNGFYHEKWIIAEEIARQQSEKKIQDFLQGLTNNQLKILSEKIGVECSVRSEPE